MREDYARDQEWAHKQIAEKESLNANLKKEQDSHMQKINELESNGMNSNDRKKLLNKFKS